MVKNKWSALVGSLLVSFGLIFPQVSQGAAKLEELVDASKQNPALPDPTRFGIKMELSDKALAKKWLAAGLAPDYEAPVHGSGMMIAAWNGDIELMQIFLDAGADVNFVNKSGESALLMAAWKNQFEAVKWLVSKGAVINPPNMSWSALHYAIFAGHHEIAKWLVERGANINAQIPNGSSALMLALYESKTEVAHWLMDLNIDLSIKNDRGHDAFVWAMRYQHKKLAERIGEAEKFALALKEPEETWGLESKSIDAPERLKELWTQQRYAQGLGEMQKLSVIEQKITKVLQEMAKAGALPAPKMHAINLSLKEEKPIPKEGGVRSAGAPIPSSGLQLPQREEEKRIDGNAVPLESLPRSATIRAKSTTGEQKIEFLFGK